jgi:hypothetical protein
MSVSDDDVNWRDPTARWAVIESLLRSSRTAAGHRRHAQEIMERLRATTTPEIWALILELEDATNAWRADLLDELALHAFQQGLAHQQGACP